MNRSESKYFKTAARMDEAFLELLEKKDLAYITVKEICEKAGVNRSTFYLHYETVSDLLTESMAYISNRLRDYYKPGTDGIVARLRDCPTHELYLLTPAYLTPYLNYVKDHKRVFRTALENAATLQLDDIYDKMFRHVFTPILDRYHVSEQDRNYIMAFYIRGLIAIITEWLKGDCADPIDHVIAVIQQCVMWRRKDKEDQ